MSQPKYTVEQLETAYKNYGDSHWIAPENPDSLLLGPTMWGFIVKTIVKTRITISQLIEIDLKLMRSSRKERLVVKRRKLEIKQNGKSFTWS